MDDVLTDIRAHHRCLCAAAAGGCRYRLGRRFNIARTVRAFVKAGAAGLHIEDQVQAKRCGHRPGKQIVPLGEMVDRIKAAVDARTDREFVIMARTDALASEGLERAIERARACVEAGADMIFPEAVTELDAVPALQAGGAGADPREHHRVRPHAAVSHAKSCASAEVDIVLYLLLGLSRHECGRAGDLSGHPPRRHAARRARADADARRAVPLPRL